VLSITIISVAALVLFHTLHDIQINEVFGALKAIKPQQIAAAALFVAGAYFTLTMRSR